MVYRKGYEDSYLDEEVDEFDGSNKTDAEKIVALLERNPRTQKDEALITKLTERLFAAARMPGIPGGQALFGIELVAKAYADLGLGETASALWERVSDLAGAIGNSVLYYKAMDELESLSAETYAEHNSKEGEDTAL